MTGYGCGTASVEGCQVTVELSSVNRRQTEVSVSLPRDLEVLEARVRERLAKAVNRGRISARISIAAGETRKADRLRVNRVLAAAYAREFKALAAELGTANGPTLDAILRAPGVLETDEGIEDTEALWPSIESALDQALAQLVDMRQREGAHLSADLAQRLGLLRQALHEIRERAPAVAVHYRHQLEERLAAAGFNLSTEDRERLMKEVALFADRSDITEEITRLESHFAQFDSCIISPEPVGRTLDFLAQEMNREVNTIGSKANDAAIGRAVVQLKSELERIREQAQNLE
jgi:uncharacterized protein (TIGR00255 family)